MDALNELIQCKLAKTFQKRQKREKSIMDGDDEGVQHDIATMNV